MPPTIPRKRLASDPPSAEPSPKRSPRHPQPRRNKASVFATLDAPPAVSRTLSQTKRLLEQGGDYSDSSELESSEDDFEDVPLPGNGPSKGAQPGDSAESEDEEWEDALGTKHHTVNHADEPAPLISGDLELTMDAPAQVTFQPKPDGKKGPSKIERQIRNLTHCMHVQFLMFHNLVRNAWISDAEVQKILLGKLPSGCWKELGRYWRDAGISDGPKRIVKGGWTAKIANDMDNSGNWKNSGKRGVQVYQSPGNATKTKIGTPKAAVQASSSKTKPQGARPSDRRQRDWGAGSDRMEPDTPNISAGEPLLHLMKYLSAFWRGTFKVTAPSLRKRGYLAPSVLETEIQAWREHITDAHVFGERVEGLSAFRDRARKCEGSRDLGQQLFTALLRGLGIEARMVASLQPAGFGWSQAEEGKARDLSNLKGGTLDPQVKVSQASKKIALQNTRKNGTRNAPIDLSDSELSDLSSALSMSSGSEGRPKIVKKSSKERKYGDELPHPTYWTEVISSLTHTPVAVSPLLRTVIAAPSMPDQLADFYCRGAAADKAKQVFAYLIAFSSDGTAKDVTTRYLPRHQWPGRTKGFRMPVEKIPVHNKRGKVKRWEEWDWFKSVLRPYARPVEKRQPWDEVEDEGDLVPAQPAKPKDMDEEGGKETLQGYKNSAEYVLERHLRREEALRPGGKIVRHFTTGKGGNEKQEPVYLRKDIVTCKSVESWHKEGRAVKEGEQPLKYVPMRAVTVQRKREIEEREREEGEKVKQGLYSKEQTDWIIPDPIVDGKIPRNAFGNIDIYTPTMIPRGAVHIPLRGTAKVCRKLKIDYAEACTGFEFGKQRAVPVLTGVVVAAENEDLVIDAWEADQAEKQRKEEEKRQKLALGLWKKFTVGLRIVQRMRREFDEDDKDPPEVQTHVTMGAPKDRNEWETYQNQADFEGGFVRDAVPSAPGGFIPESVSASQEDQDDTGGGFLLSSQEEAKAEEFTFTIDHGSIEEPKQRHIPSESAYQTPVSLDALPQKSPPEADNDIEKESQLGDDSDGEEAPPTRSTRRTRPTKRKLRASTLGSDDEEEESNDDDDDDDASLVTPLASPPLRKRKPSIPPPSSASPPTTSKRRVPQRRAARKSDAQVKSHFFAHDTDDETDATEPSPVKGGGARGKGRGRGRARGRGRGKA